MLSCSLAPAGPSLSREDLLLLLEQADLPCPGCRYNLRGLRTLTCPECGNDLESNPRLHSTRGARLKEVDSARCALACFGAPAHFVSVLLLTVAAKSIVLRGVEAIDGSVAFLVLFFGPPSWAAFVLAAWMAPRRLPLLDRPAAAEAVLSLAWMLALVLAIADTLAAFMLLMVLASAAC